MALKSELMAAGMPAAMASKVGFDPLTNFAPAGSTQAAATLLSANFANLTTASAGGVIINERHAKTLIINSSGNTQTVYPPVGSFLNNGTVNVGLTLGNGLRMSIEAAGTQFFTTTSA